MLVSIPRVRQLVSSGLLSAHTSMALRTTRTAGPTWDRELLRSTTVWLVLLL